MTILKKEFIVNGLSDKVEHLSNGNIVIEKEKLMKVNSIKDMENQIYSLKNELISKDHDIERFKNNQFVLEKHIEILENKINILKE